MSSIDIMPTLLDVAGVVQPVGLPGVNLIDRRAVDRRPSIFGGCFSHDVVDFDRPASGLRWRWIISGSWKLIVPNSAIEPAGKIELYHLREDPWEREDRSVSSPGRVRRMRRELDRWWSAPL